MTDFQDGQRPPYYFCELDHPQRCFDDIKTLSKYDVDICIVVFKLLQFRILSTWFGNPYFGPFLEVLGCLTAGGCLTWINPTKGTSMAYFMHFVSLLVQIRSQVFALRGIAYGTTRSAIADCIQRAACETWNGHLPIGDRCIWAQILPSYRLPKC